MCSDNDNKDETMSFFAHAREYRSFLSWARMRTRKNSFAQVRIKRGKEKIVGYEQKDKPNTVSFYYSRNACARYFCIDVFMGLLSIVINLSSVGKEWLRIFTSYFCVSISI